MALTPDQQAVVDKASREDVNGWIHVTVAGSPHDCGFQHGYLLAAEYADALRTYEAMTMECFGIPYSFLVENAVKMHKSKITADILEEMGGMADGFTAAGVATTVDDLIGWNAWMELTDYWWPTVAEQYSKNPPKGPRGSHCSGLVATGSATPDGKVVIAHESFDDFWSGQYFNICLDITPTAGHRLVMQTVPGYVASMTDFYVTGAGLGITETTLAGFRGYDPEKSPEYVRARRACQYADNIDHWVELMHEGDNGGYANTWLLADANSGEIARYEEGLVYQKLDKTTDGTFFGCNAAFDPRIRNLECADVGFNDPRQQTGARRQRFMELLDQYHGKIDIELAKKILADTYDPYLGYINPSSRGICSHYDQDPMYYACDPTAVWNVPFYPAGSVDGKAADASDILSMSMWGRYGRADGVEFDADQFLREHPLWNWQQPYLKSRPSQPWTHFVAKK